MPGHALIVLIPEDAQIFHSIHSIFILCNFLPDPTARLTQRKLEYELQAEEHLGWRARREGRRRWSALRTSVSEIFFSLSIFSISLSIVSLSIFSHQFCIFALSLSISLPSLSFLFITFTFQLIVNICYFSGMAKGYEDILMGYGARSRVQSTERSSSMCRERNNVTEEKREEEKRKRRSQVRIWCQITRSRKRRLGKVPGVRSSLSSGGVDNDILLSNLSKRWTLI